MQDTITARDILRRAREILTPAHRWHQGWLFGPDGESYCAIGAIRKASDQMLGYDEDDQIVQALEIMTATDAVRETACLATWNDAPGRTHEEVLRLFDAAIGGK